MYSYHSNCINSSLSTCTHHTHTQIILSPIPPLFLHLTDSSFLSIPLSLFAHYSQVSRLRSTIDACISDLSTPAGPLDLISSGHNVVSGCPDRQCQISTSLTFLLPRSSASFPLTKRTTSYVKLQFSFQTR